MLISPVNCPGPNVATTSAAAVGRTTLMRPVMTNAATGNADKTLKGHSRPVGPSLSTVG
jgi:hypothetical protein